MSGKNVLETAVQLKLIKVYSLAEEFDVSFPEEFSDLIIVNANQLKDMKKNHDELKEKYNALKQDHEELLARIRRQQ